jgi:cell division transport system permease protein
MPAGWFMMAEDDDEDLPPPRGRPAQPRYVREPMGRSSLPPRPARPARPQPNGSQPNGSPRSDQPERPERPEQAAPPPRRRAREGSRRLLRPVGFDDLGLRRALSDRLLPFLVAAMAFLAALTFAGAMATANLARHWQRGAEAELTIQVPTPDGPAIGRAGDRLDAVLGILRGEAGVLSAKAMTSRELTDLLKPWLGASGRSLDLPLPAVISVQLAPGGQMPGGLAARLQAAAPETMMESADIWAQRLSALARSLQACAAVALLLVIAVAVAVVTVATRAGLAARRDSIEIVHGLGATDSYIAGRFARRAMRLAGAGGVGGAVAALPVLLWLAALAAPFTQGTGAEGGAPALLALPIALWIALPALPLAAATIGYVTAEVTVRRWLRRLP